MLKTKEYDKFNFCKYNRAAIDHKHVNKLAESIKARNMLEFRPIECDSDLNIIDGQHRCLAAKKLGVDIYYTINEKFQKGDIINLNINKAWTPSDFLNYYVLDEKEEYKKLAAFMLKHNLDIRVALKLTRKDCNRTQNDFRLGTYVFVEEENAELFEICWQTIDYIKKMNIHCTYTRTSRFWNALIKLIRHADFNAEKWFGNMKRMIERFDVRATENDYLKLFMEVHNWHNLRKLDLIERDL